MLGESEMDSNANSSLEEHLSSTDAYVFDY